MQIQDGKLYLNRTWKYIYPALRVYGFQPISYLNDLIKQGVGIHDINFNDEEPHIPKIFILIQTQVPGMRGAKAKEYEEKVNKFFNYIRQQSYYVDDYLYNIKDNCCSHMVVIKFPQYFLSIYNHFKKGEYSKMFPEDSVIKKYFPLENLSKVSSSLTVTLSKTLGANLEIHRVLKKDISYKKEFVEILNKDFNTNLKVEELKDEAELDYLPLLEEEVFNFKNKIS